MSEKDMMLIEHDLPIEEISKQSVREKSIRHGNISTLHIWWARKPLAACRAAIYASLIPKPASKEKAEEEKNLIQKLVNWDNVKTKSYDENLIKKARNHILKSFDSKKPRILDPFAGGGSIPLESLRLGCETHALELNPVATLITKGCCEFPQIFSSRDNLQQRLGDENEKMRDIEYHNLSDDFEKWARKVYKDAEVEIGKFYQDKSRKTPVGYLWARTIHCQNPSCRAEVPLLYNFWLVQKKNRMIALKPVVDKAKKTINFEIKRDSEIDFDPSKGTTKRGKATCPVCSSTIAQEAIKEEANRNGLGQRLVGVVLQNPEGRGKIYRVASKHDEKILKQASEYLEERIENWDDDFSPILNEPLPTPDRKGASEELELFFNFASIVLYNMRKWDDIYNPRQKLALLTFVDKVRETYKELLENTGNKKYVKALVAYLAFAIDRLADRGNTLCTWNCYRETIEHATGIPAISMKWAYAEVNPFSNSTGNFLGAVNWIKRVINHCKKTSDFPATVKQGDATRLPYPSNYFDAIITDPPYYDNIPYSDLSDLFYVWLKRTLRDIYPDLFSTPLTPKQREIIQNISLLRGESKEASTRRGDLPIKTNESFEDLLLQSFKEINRVLKQNGILSIIFAHKETEAWKTLICTLLRSNLVITASWPIHTEKAGRLRAQKSAALKSSVYFACRKIDRKEETYFEDIEEDIKERIEDRLDYFWKTGIRGADFFVSAIGPAVEVFGKYKKVKDYSGKTKSISKLLEFIENHVTQYALRQILKSPLGKLDSITRFYLVWRWAYKNEKIPFDMARLLAQALGLEITDYAGKEGLIQKSKGKIKISNPKERGNQFIEKPLKNPTMIDVMHKAAVYWKNGDKKKLNKILQENNYVEDEHFWKVVQAISEVLPKGDSEKKMLQGLLAGRESLEKAPKLSKITDFGGGVK